jgi:hypothetical protein
MQMSFSLLAITLAIVCSVTPVSCRRRMLSARTESPEDAYRRAVPHLRGGGIHPGGQPYVPPPPSNYGGYWC